MDELFKRATKIKLRYTTPTGKLSTEDLWDLPLKNGKTSLNNIAKSLSKALKETEEEDFVGNGKRKNTTLELKFEIVKQIIKERLDDNERKEKIAENKAKKELIMEIISNKKNEDLKGQSVENLEKMLNEL